MRFHDPARPRLGDWPTWRDAPGIALPQLSVLPDEAGGFDVSLQFPTEEARPGFYRIARHVAGVGELVKLLEMWEEDPELAVAFWWGKAAPGPTPTLADATPARPKPQLVKLDL